MKKILILTRSFGMGGTEVALNKLLCRMDRKKYDITLMVIEKYGEMLSRLPDDITVKKIPLKNEKYRMYINYRKMPDSNIKVVIDKLQKAFVKKYYAGKSDESGFYEYILSKSYPLDEKYDVVLDYMGYGGFTTFYGAVSVKAPKKAMWLHDEKIDWLENVKNYMKYYDRFFCVSETVKKQFQKEYPEYASKAQVLYNYMDVDEIVEKSKESIDDDRFNAEYKIVTVGRYATQKGYDYAIKASGILKERNRKFCWYGIGAGGELDEYQKLIDELGVGDCFKFIGKKSNPYPYISNCDLYAQPSRNEGFGLAVFEAKVLGKPVLISDTPCLKEQIRDGENGYVAALDEKAIADCICRIMDNPKDVQRIINNVKSEDMHLDKEIDKLYEYIDC